MDFIDSLIVKIALIGLLGIGAQWIAWRTGKPAIALMLLAGLVAGPVTGIIVPERDFGALLEPIVKLAVAVILFDGGLSLRFREIRHHGGAILALVLIGVPVGWALGSTKSDPPLPALGSNVVWNLATNTLLAVGLGIAAAAR